jgi:hypothetical protein
MDLFHGSSLDEAGEVRLEQKLGTTPKAMKEVFGGMPRSRIALAGLLIYLCFEHLNNLGAYSIPSEDRPSHHICLQESTQTASFQAVRAGGKA